MPLFDDRALQQHIRWNLRNHHIRDTVLIDVATDGSHQMLVADMGEMHTAARIDRLRRHAVWASSLLCLAHQRLCFT